MGRVLIRRAVGSSGALCALWVCWASWGLTTATASSAPIGFGVNSQARAMPAGPTDPKLRGHLAKLFPSAQAFSSKEPSPPHFKAYVPDTGGAQKVVGLAFWTTELEPLERGYDGPIKMLVGMDMAGRLTGVVVVEHHEPYGYFSVDTAEFPAQFVGKSIRDAFQVGRDVDAIARASITMLSATRAVRNSARRVARALLTPPSEPTAAR
jgi:NosR/NirI family transcriptional regulator, nitrous oxide reductase regulator